MTHSQQHTSRISPRPCCTFAQEPAVGETSCDRTVLRRDRGHALRGALLRPTPRIHPAAVDVTVILALLGIPACAAFVLRQQPSCTFPVVAYGVPSCTPAVFPVEKERSCKTFWRRRCILDEPPGWAVTRRWQPRGQATKRNDDLAQTTPLLSSSRSERRAHKSG
jgi:hypothetical protein